MPLDIELAATILVIGQFQPNSGAKVPELPINNKDGVPLYWKRLVPEENCTVSVSLSGSIFEASISPSISNMDHHKGKRITAGIYFEICAKYAEKVGGEVIQKATVVGCKLSEQGTGIVIARYPSMPMLWQNVCNGFQTELLSEESPL